MEKGLLEGLNILLIEEEVVIAMDVEQICTDQGAASVLVVNTLAGFSSKLLDKKEIDAAILDVQIGEHSTADVARLLEERRIPFIFATSYSDAEQFFARFPQVAVVTKPYSTDELLEALAAALAKS